jgi:hypothetical protein
MQATVNIRDAGCDAVAMRAWPMTVATESGNAFHARHEIPVRNREVLLD